MASIYSVVSQKLENADIRVPAGISAAEAIHKVALAALPKLVLEAFSAGIRPLLSDWVEMVPEEQALWQKFHEEEQTAQKVFQATLAGNTVIAKGLLHEGDSKAQALDAMEAGLNLANL